MYSSRIISGTFQDNFGELVCGHCRIGTLTTDQFQHYVFEESKRLYDAQHCDWENQGYLFLAALRCANPACSEITGCTGEMYIDIDVDSYGNTVGSNILSPKFFSRGPKLVDLPSKLPRSIVNELSLAEALFWQDPSSSVSRLRRCLEVILDDQKIKQSVLTVKSKRKRLSLHERLDILQSKLPKANPSSSLTGEIAIALKWVGNEAVHASIDRNAALISFRFIEHVISELYGKKTDTLATYARSATKSKGRRLQS